MLGALRGPGGRAGSLARPARPGHRGRQGRLRQRRRRAGPTLARRDPSHPAGPPGRERCGGRQRAQRPGGLPSGKRAAGAAWTRRARARSPLARRPAIRRFPLPEAGLAPDPGTGVDGRMGGRTPPSPRSAASGPRPTAADGETRARAATATDPSARTVAAPGRRCRAGSWGPGDGSLWGGFGQGQGGKLPWGSDSGGRDPSGAARPAGSRAARPRPARLPDEGRLDLLGLEAQRTVHRRVEGLRRHLRHPPLPREPARRATRPEPGRLQARDEEAGRRSPSVS